MEQRHILGTTEPVSEEELRALVERFGERQMAPPGQPTVMDVAETLQVEPETVAAMLMELRESKTQAEVKERLDRLERENAELHARTRFLADHGSQRRAVALGLAAFVAGLVALLVVRGFAGASGMWTLAMIPAALVVTLLLVFVSKQKRG